MCRGRRMGCVVVGGSLPLVSALCLWRKIGGRLVDGGGEVCDVACLFLLSQ